MEEETEVCLQQCESCQQETDIETMAMDDDSNYFCSDCWAELGPILKAEYEELKIKGEIE
jgi:hypothetical protein